MQTEERSRQDPPVDPRRDSTRKKTKDARGPQSSEPMGPKQPETPQNPWRRAWVWWVLMLGLLIWNVLTFLPTTHPEAAIPYSMLLSQVAADNVKSVRISGSQITGDFVQAILWPPSTPALTPSAASPTAAATQSSQPTPLPPPSPYSKFSTTFPEVIGDTNLVSLLQSHKVVIDVTPPPNPIVTALLSNGLPLLLLIVGVVWIGRQFAKSQSGALGFGRSRARRYEADRPEVTFKDVAGADEAKGELQEVVDFLQQPKKYHDLGARIPRGVLLVGAPGTGKTLMARAVAGEAGVPFYNISASEFVEMFVGVGASRVRDLFEKAKTTAPSILFIDEMDAVGRRRGAGVGMVNDEREQTLNQLLVEMDGFDEHHEVIVLAATNRPDVLDPALLRPGRFDRRVTVPLPDRQGREGILRIHTRDLPLAPDVNLELLSRTTIGFSGADLANLSNEAALTAARHNHQKVARVDFEEAMDKIILGGERPRLSDPQERRVVAYHEAGHALVAWLTPGADPVHKVTIIPRGQTLGVTEQLPADDRLNYSQQYLLARLDVILGGRVAEQIALDHITTGAENDLVQATRLSRRMMTRWGMGSLGPVAFQADEEQPFLGYALSQGKDYSEATAARIDHDVETLLKGREEEVRGLLTGHKRELDSIVDALLHEETIIQDDLTRILGARPESAGGATVAQQEA
jgi:cell division protease FtsH